MLSVFNYDTGGLLFSYLTPANIVEVLDFLQAVGERPLLREFIFVPLPSGDPDKQDVRSILHQYI